MFWISNDTKVQYKFQFKAILKIEELLFHEVLVGVNFNMAAYYS